MGVIPIDPLIGEVAAQLLNSISYLWQSNRKLVARRGFPTLMLLVGTQDFDNHTIILQFELDNGNANSEGHRHVRLEHQNQNSDQIASNWHAEIVKVEGSQIFIKLIIPYNEIVGCWRLKIFVGQKGSEPSTLRESYVSVQQRTRIYLIYNAFNKQDGSYFEHRSLRDYYLNTETELWFSGTAIGPGKDYTFRKEPWTHSQFEESTMKTVMLLLERLSVWHQEKFRGGLSYTDRRCVARVARKLSFAINYILLRQQDDILDKSSISSFDRPSGEWISSSEIIEEFIQGRQPVLCSGSHVYSNVFVSLLRCIGICARSCTCIASAHDTNMLLTADRAFVRPKDSQTFSPMKRSENIEFESTSVYHVWTELFTKRPDLSKGGDYDGWQTIDAMPQNDFGSVSQCGPCSVKAIREGRLHLPYDCSFFYGQLNASVFKWFYEQNSENEYRLLDVERKDEAVGCSVLISNPRAFGYPMDVTSDYKQSTTESQSNIKALKLSGLMERQERVRLLYNQGMNPSASDVSIAVKDIGWVIHGDDISVQVEFTNNASLKRCIQFSVRIHVQKPNGRLAGQINSFQDRIELKPSETESLKLFTPIADYSKHTSNENLHVSLVAIISALIEQTGQSFYHEEKFQLSGSSVTLIASSIGQLNESLIGIIVVKNPLPETLTNVELLLHGGKSNQATKVERFPREIHPGQRVKIHIRFKPTRLGNRFLIAVVNSSQIQNLTALHLFRSVQANHV